MSHGITDKDQTFVVSSAAWHGLSTILDSPPSCEEAIKLANLGWKAVLEEMFLKNGDKIPEAFAICRDDTKDVLGTVGSRYTPLQNQEAFSFFDPLIEQKIFSIETAGSLFGGKRVWILAKFNEDFTLGATDKISRYALLSNSHDGTSAVVVKSTSTRVVCFNTLSMSLRDGNSDKFSIRHTKTVKDRTETAFSLLDSIQKQFKKNEVLWARMAEFKMPPVEFIKYVEEVFPTPKGTDNTKRISTKRAEVSQLFLGGAGHDLETADNTLWGAWNAVTNYTSHAVSNRKDASQERKLNDLWFGKRDEVNSKALDVAVSWMKESGVDLKDLGL